MRLLRVLFFNSLLELKTFIIMAKFDLTFGDSEFDYITIQCKKIENPQGILICINQGLSLKQIRLDKSTAIKFAKTLRTEINKITESEVKNVR